MDFLDPKRKKSHHRRLLTGYLLMAVALALATWLLLNSSFGYWVDPKTGSIIQNGTVFVDSQPGGSNVILNGQQQRNQTATRLVLPGSQQYNIRLTLDGYRDWSRTFSLTGGKIERLVYPLLIPKTLNTSESQLYASPPGITSQSLDRRWLLIQQPGQTYVFDLYDLNSPANPPATITIPASLLTDPTQPSTLIFREWASDNRHVLVERLFNNAHEFLMLDTATVASSQNINTTLTVTPSTVELRDKKADQLYIYDAAGGLLRLGDLKGRTVTGALLSNVLDYKQFGTDLILYATHDGAATGKLSYRIRENDKATYLLKSVADSQNYMLDVGEFDGTPYFVIGSEQDDAVLVYRDPLPTLKGQNQSPLLISAVLRIDNPKFAYFSPGSQFIAAQSANRMIVYDIDGDRQYKINLDHQIAPSFKFSWMDGYRLVFAEKGESYMVDFDGSNEQRLVPLLGENGPFFTPDYKMLFSISPSKTVTGRYALTDTSLQKK